MRNELQKYLDKVYPTSKVGTPHSIFGDVHIRFELGGDESFKIIRDGVEVEWWNDKRKMTKVDKANREAHIEKRVLQATSRATTIFHETFDNLETEARVILRKVKVKDIQADKIFNGIAKFACLHLVWTKSL